MTLRDFIPCPIDTLAFKYSLCLKKSLFALIVLLKNVVFERIEILKGVT